MLGLLFTLPLLAFSASAALECDAVPWKLPFHTANDPHIYSADNKEVTYLGTNWPGHQNAMIPEGLQYSSVKDIVSHITGLGLNSVRLTFAIELVDDIYDGVDATLEYTLTNALGAENGTIVLGKVLAHNPQFTKDTTRLEVYDAVALELAAQGVYLHLDNHVSKAIWCCSNNDGNAWFGDEYFNVTNWLRGWKFMAAHGAANWPSFSSVGIRNELRQPTSGLGDPDPWDWYSYYVHMTSAAATIHAANPDVLLFFTGWNYDGSVSTLVDGQLLNGTANTTTAGKSALFVPSSFPYQEKIVLELHWYDFQHTEVNCSVFAAGLLGSGYNSYQGPAGGAKYHLPIVLTEWGFIQNGTYWFDTTYNDCLIQFMAEYKPSGWIQWELSGSFYIKSTGVPLVSVQDVDEGWGLLNHTWNGIRSPITVANSLDKMISALKN